MKKITATIIAITFLFNFSFSQDIIHLKNGFIINAKVLEIGSTNIYYKPYLQTNDSDTEKKQANKKKTCKVHCLRK